MTEIIHRFFARTSRHYEWCTYLNERGLQVDIEKSTELIYLWAEYQDWFLNIILQKAEEPVPEALREIKETVDALDPRLMSEGSAYTVTNVSEETAATNPTNFRQPALDNHKQARFTAFLHENGYAWMTDNQADILWEAGSDYRDHLCRPNGATPFRSDPRLEKSDSEILPLRIRAWDDSETNAGVAEW